MFDLNQDEEHLEQVLEEDEADLDLDREDGIITKSPTKERFKVDWKGSKHILSLTKRIIDIVR